MSLVNGERSFESQEDMSYDTPPITYIWLLWQEMQAAMLLSFTRFQHIIEQGQRQLTLSMAIEIQKIGISPFKKK